jgi:hypothetical protein
VTPGHVRPRVDWSALDDALSRAADAGYVPSFWWRDDDAVRHTPALDRLLTLARQYEAPVALAAIPARAEPSLAERLREEPLATVLVHGLAHANHAPAGEKKAEFGAHRPLGEVVAEAGHALATARRVSAFSNQDDAIDASVGAASLPARGGRVAPAGATGVGRKPDASAAAPWFRPTRAGSDEPVSALPSRGGMALVPVFVPPWNRAAPELVSALPALGYRGVSMFKDRRAALATPGLVQVNTHIDPIDWQAGGGLADAAMLGAMLARAITDRTEGRADRAEAIGLLTHHLVHDDAVWAFCEECVAHLSHRRGMRFLAARVLFGIDREDGADRSVRQHG